MKEKIKPRREVVLKNNTLINMLINSNFLNIDMINEKEQKIIFKDLSFSQAHRSRNSNILSKQLQVVCANEIIKENFEELFNIDLIAQILETYLYGFNVFEVNYKLKHGFYFPILKQRDFRNFGFNEENELIYNGNGLNEKVQDLKAIYALFGSNFLFLNGDALINKLYFPIKLKNASLKFWMEFLEKFGSPWAVAKTDADPDDLANEVYQMLNGDSAVIDKEEELELIQPNNNANYQELINYLDNQIRSVILGGNLSSQVNQGSKAAAQIHNDIRKDFSTSDANIVLYVLNRAIKFFKKINNFNEELYVQFFNEFDPKEALCKRDKMLFDMGFVFDEQYLKNTYNIQGHLKKQENIKEIFENKVSLKEDFEEDFIDKALKQKEYLKLDEDMANLFKEKFEKIISECKDYDEVLKILQKDFSALKQTDFEKYLYMALVNSNILGYLED